MNGHLVAQMSRSRGKRPCERITLNAFSGNDLEDVLCHLF